MTMGAVLFRTGTMKGNELGGLYKSMPWTTFFCNQLQLLLFAILAFAVLQQTGLYPSELPKINLDTDWFYRRALPNLVTVCCVQAAPMLKTIDAGFVLFREWLLSLMYALFGPTGLLGRKWSTGGMALWAAILLGVYLVLYYL